MVIHKLIVPLFREYISNNVFSWKPNISLLQFRLTKFYQSNTSHVCENAPQNSRNGSNELKRRKSLSFMNQLELALQRERICLSGICQLYYTMYTSNINITIRKVSPSFIMKRAKTKWTTLYLLEISPFLDFFQKCKFSLSQSESPWLFLVLW